MRIAVLIIVALALTGCKHFYDGRDGMDGAGVAAVLRQIQQEEKSDADRTL